MKTLRPGRDIAFERAVLDLAHRMGRLDPIGYARQAQALDDEREALAQARARALGSLARLLAERGRRVSV